jgi:2,5-diketo-D-gluconate reductase A
VNVAAQAGTTRSLADGNSMPLLGLGVWQVPNGPECVNAVRWALELGYRHIDTAQAYGNEQSVGQGLREGGIARDEVFITTKFYPARKDPVAAAERSLERLGLDYVDLYIIHWPEGGPTWAWPGMEQARELGYARSIGVSNFGVDELRQLLATATVPPVVDQVQFSPYAYRKALLDACRQNEIALEAYSSLGTGRHLTSDTVVRIARRHGRTAAQVLLRWCIERGVPIIPKSTPPRAHRRERAALRLSALGPKHRRARRARPHRRHRPRSRTQMVASLTARLQTGHDRLTSERRYTDPRAVKP